MLNNKLVVGEPYFSRFSSSSFSPDPKNFFPIFLNEPKVGRRPYSEPRAHLSLRININIQAKKKKKIVCSWRCGGKKSKLCSSLDCLLHLSLHSQYVLQINGVASIMLITNTSIWRPRSHKLVCLGPFQLPSTQCQEGEKPSEYCTLLLSKEGFELRRYPIASCQFFLWCQTEYFCVPAGFTNWDPHCILSLVYYSLGYGS